MVGTGDRLPVDQAAHRGPQHVGVADRLLAVEPSVDLDLAAELLGQLAHERGVGALPLVDLAAWQLPPTCGGGWIRTAGGEQPPVADDGGADDEGSGVDAVVVLHGAVSVGLVARDVTRG